MMRKKISLALALAICLPVLLSIFPATAYASGGDFYIFGGSGGGGGSGGAAGGAGGAGGARSRFFDQSGLNGAGGAGSVAGGGGGGGEAGVRDGTLFHSGAAAQNAPNTGWGGDGAGASGGKGGAPGVPGARGGAGDDGTDNCGGGGGGVATDTNAPAMKGGKGGDAGSGNNLRGAGGAGGAGAGFAAFDLDNAAPDRGRAYTFKHTMRHTSYNSVYIEGGNAGHGGNCNTAGAYAGVAGAGGAVEVVADSSVTVSDNMFLYGGNCGNGGDATAGHAGDGGYGGIAEFITNHDLTVNGELRLETGNAGKEGISAGAGGVGGKGTTNGGAFRITVKGTLTAPTINITGEGKMNFSIFDVEKLAVGEDTTITLTNTLWQFVSINQVDYTAGKTLTINGTKDDMFFGKQGTENPPAPLLSGAALPGGQAGVPYSHSLAAYAGGIMPLTFTLAPGSTLPDGLSLSQDGTITGTPTTNVHNHTFHVELTDGSGSFLQDPTTAKSAMAAFTLNMGGGEIDDAPTYIRRTLTDKQTGVTVTGSMTSFARLTVRERVLHAEGHCPACDEIRARIAAGELILLYDISISGGYTGELEVSIPVGEQYNGQTVTILHCKNGVLESVTCVVQNGVATGTFKRLSPFAVVRGVNVGVPENTVVDPPKTGDAPIGGMAGVGLVLCALGVLVLARKKSIRHPER